MNPTILSPTRIISTSSQPEPEIRNDRLLVISFGVVGRFARLPVVSRLRSRSSGGGYTHEA